jgi:hypothetical protein
MGFFKSSKSHLELLEKDCQEVATHSAAIREACDASLRGKYEYMRPEQRADLVRNGALASRKLQAALESARSRQKVMEADQCPSEDLLAAETRLLAASLDASRAQQALKDAKDSLIAGVAEIEEFYGAKSSEAKHLRKVIAEFQAT